MKPKIPPALAALAAKAKFTGKKPTRDEIKAALPGNPNLAAKLPAGPREVPTVFRNLVRIEYFRKFTFRERIAILIGGNVVQMIGIATQHSPGKFQPVIISKVSKHTTPDAHMQEVIENTLVAKESPVANLLTPDFTD